MSAPSKMDKGAPEVGESSSSSEVPIPMPPPVASNTLVPSYEVGVMRQSSGYHGVHPYCDVAICSIPRRMVGQPFQEWLAIAHAFCRLPEGDPSCVDISIPDVVKLNVGTVSLECQSGSGINGIDVPVVVVPGLSSLVGS